MRQQPPNREIGFVLFSFRFVSCVRAGGRGEAAWARVGRDSLRWGFRDLVWTCVCVCMSCSRCLLFNFLCAGMWVLKVFAQFVKSQGAVFERRHVGFKVSGPAPVQLLCAGTWVLSYFKY